MNNDYEKDFGQIHTKRLWLRHFQPGDEDYFFSFLSDAESCWMDGGYDPYLERDEEFHRLMEELSAQQGRYMMVDKSTGETVGTIRLWNTDTPGEAEVGYDVSPYHRRKGYASEALTALIQVAFAAGGVDTIVAEVFDYNPISATLVEKVGFQKVGQITEVLRSGESRVTLRYEYKKGE
jgi:RimJ/RimL family protein N-acetyltransferase